MYMWLAKLVYKAKMQYLSKKADTAFRLCTTVRSRDLYLIVWEVNLDVIHIKQEPLGEGPACNKADWSLHMWRHQPGAFRRRFHVELNKHAIRGIYDGLLLAQCRRWWTNSNHRVNPWSAVIDFRRHNLTSVDVRLWRLKSVPALKN